MLRDLWDCKKSCNVCVIGIPEGEKKKDRTEKVFKETMAKNFLDLARHNPTVFRR